jgi:VanZ family protein
LALPHQQWIRSPFAIITLMILAIILYGTLYPFEFHAGRYATGPVHALFLTYRTLSNRADILANILLFMPLGFFIVQSLRRQPGFFRVVLVTVGSLLLSTGIELLQFYDDDRQTALSDVYSNTAGACIGAAAGVLFYRKFNLTAIESTHKRPFVALLLLCWLGYRLFPYVPVIDLHKYWHAVRPLLYIRPLPVLDLYRHTVLWLAVALLIEALFDNSLHRWIFALLVPAVWLARIVIGEIILSPAEVAGGVLAVAIWIGFLCRLRARAVVIAILFTSMIAFQALQPFRFSTSARPFGWVPFRGFLQGSLAVNVQSFLEKAFTYGALVWLAVRAGCSWRLATLAGGALVLCLRLAQVYIPGRSAEITDTLILLMAAAMMRILREGCATNR